MSPDRVVCCRQSPRHLLLDRTAHSALRALREDRYWVLLKLEARREPAALEHPLLPPSALSGGVFVPAGGERAATGGGAGSGSVVDLSGELTWSGLDSLPAARTLRVQVLYAVAPGRRAQLVTPGSPTGSAGWRKWPARVRMARRRRRSTREGTTGVNVHRSAASVTSVPWASGRG